MVSKRELLVKAKLAMKAETKAEVALLKAARVRKEFSAYLHAYKRAAEARRKATRKVKVAKKPKWQRDFEEAIKRHREEGMDEEEITERYGEGN